MEINEYQLTGINNVEASAGTGKTYTIILLYFRRLMTKWLKDPTFKIENILVVTFTEAATKELKGRILKLMYEARAFYSTGVCDDETKCEVFALFSTDKKKALALTNRAIREINNASIYTIHGFCHHVLRDYSIESGTPMQFKLVKDPKDDIERVIKDYWRDILMPEQDSPKNKAIWQLHSSFKIDLKKLLNTFPYLLKDSATEIYEDNINFDEAINYLNAVEKALKETADFVNRNREEISDQLAHGEPALNGGKYKPNRKQDIRNLIDHIPDIDFNEFLVNKSYIEACGLYATSRLESNLKKDFTFANSFPDTRFFDLLEDLFGAVTNLANIEHQFEATVFKEIKRRMVSFKKKQHRYWFDDLLRNLDHALEQQANLTEKLITHYPYAFIDEFQDTDPVQFSIFKKIYIDQKSKYSDSLLYLIGDPKQSIYGFRNADINAYLSAQKECDKRYSLDTNYRTSSELLQKIESFWKINSNPFNNPEIKFYPVKSGKNDIELESSDFLKESFLFTEIIHSEKMNVGVLRSSTADYISNQVAGILNNNIQIRLENENETSVREVVPGDIAILVRKHAQAELVQKTLKERGIDAVIFSKQSVYQSQEAEEVLKIMQAILHPERSNYLKAALLCSPFDVSVDQLKKWKEESESISQDFAEYRALFVSAQKLWFKKGIMNALRVLFSQTDAWSHLIDYTNAERRIINYQHLLSLLSDLERVDSLSPHSLVRRFRDKIENSGSEEEESQLLLDNDKDLVKIVTIHYSKGLEFPFVFIPYIWDDSSNSPKSPFSLSLNVDNRSVKKITFDGNQQIDGRTLKEIKVKQEQNELIRNLYVAMTRASYFCELINIESDDSNHSRMINRFLGKSSQNNNYQDSLLKSGIEIRRIKSTKIGKIVVEREQQPHPVKAREFAAEQPVPGFLSLSFSSLAKTQITDFHTDELREEVTARDVDLIVGVSEPKNVKENAESESLEGSARVGNLFHNILEKIEFYNPVISDEIILKEIEVQGISLHHFDYIKSICNVTLEKKLTRADDSFALNQLDPALIKKELEFLTYSSPDRLNKCLEELKKSPLVSTEIVQNYVRGFIDLIFWHNNRWYIIDYKSNKLDDYSPEVLNFEMQRHHYDLQYHLYAAVMDNYYQRTLSSYNTQTHFGGVYYLFLRGLKILENDQNGVFYDRIDSNRLKVLSNSLVNEE